VGGSLQRLVERSRWPPASGESLFSCLRRSVYS
jgi:hypothetical protein